MERAVFHNAPIRIHRIRLMRTIDKLDRCNFKCELALTPDIRTFPTPSVKNVQWNSGRFFMAVHVDLER